MSTTTTNRCPYFTRLFARVQSSIGGTMKIKSMLGFCFLFVFAAILSPGSANARILTNLSGTEAHVSNNSVFMPQSTVVQCEDGSILEFFYVQRIIINGKPEMVLTEFTYAPGTHELYLEGTCDGQNLYGLSSCACRSAAFIDSVFIKNIEAVRWPTL